MLNKNVADYTNFQGKTNKKIVQPPGGTSSFSLAWSNEKTDYGPQKYYKKSNRDTYSDYQARYQPYNYSQPMKVMEETSNKHGYKKVKNDYVPQNVGGGYGYTNYNNASKYRADQPILSYDQPQSYGDYGMTRKNQVEQLDIAVQEQKVAKNTRPYSMPRQQSGEAQGRSSIRINGPPRDNNIFGGNDYNYWKDPNNKTVYNKKQSGTSQKKLNQPFLQYYGKKNYTNNEKTITKSCNPPREKQTFIFG